MKPLWTKKTTTHHRICKSQWGNNHFDNRLKMSEIRHRALHILFENSLPNEQISTILDINGKAIIKDFRQDIMSVIDDYWNEAYNHKCFKR